MESVTLKTGATIPIHTFIETYKSLRSLAESDDPFLFYEFVMLCRDSNHEFWNHNTQQRLNDLSLIQADGHIQDDVREVVLSATEGEGLDLTLLPSVNTLQLP
jgi:hypothetical protein